MVACGAPAFAPELALELPRTVPLIVRVRDVPFCGGAVCCSCEAQWWTAGVCVDDGVLDVSLFPSIDVVLVFFLFLPA